MSCENGLFYIECKEKKSPNCAANLTHSSNPCKKTYPSSSFIQKFLYVSGGTKNEQSAPSVRRSGRFRGTRYLCACRDNGLVGRGITTATAKRNLNNLNQHYDNADFDDP